MASNASKYIPFLDPNREAGQLEGADMKIDTLEATDIAANAITTSELANDAVETLNIKDANVTLAKIVNGTGLSLIGRSANTVGVNADIVGTDGQALRVSGTALGFGTIVTAGIADANVTLAKLESTLQKGIITAMMSFETAEQTATTIYFPYKVTINKMRGIVMKALGATDTGTITGANATGDSAGGVITGAISAALNTEYAETPTTNNVVLADGYYKLTSAKTTAGGKMLVTLEYTRTA